MDEVFPRAWTIGAAGQGIGGGPSKWRNTPELCPYFFHPPVTYNPWTDRSWCLCGRKTYPGQCESRIHLACCDGALTEPSPAYIAWEEEKNR